jgi:hypothetical protein
MAVDIKALFIKYGIVAGSQNQPHITANLEQGATTSTHDNIMMTCN